jgi:hypothetical protein
MAALILTARAPSERPPTRLRWRRVLSGFLAVFLVAEVAVRTLEPHLEPVNAWPTSDYVSHEQGLAARQDDLQVLVLGSSVAGRAIAPDALTAEGGPGPGYNYWLAGASVRSFSMLTVEVLLDRVSPSLVVIGLTMRELNDGESQRSQTGALERSSAFRAQSGRAGVIDRLDDELQSGVALARRRRLLRDPLALYHQLRSPAIPPVRVGPDGILADLGWSRLADEPEEHLVQERAAMANYDVSDDELMALGQLLDELHHRGIKALVVNLPVTDQFIAMADGGPDDYDLYLNGVEAVTAQHGAHWFDAMREPWADGYFADVNHLNDSGTARLQPLLLDAIDRLPVAVSVRGDAAGGPLGRP